MRKDMIIAGIASLALMPAVAFAQQTPCEQQSSNRVGGTVVGAGVGALAGSAIAGRGSHTEGAILGGVAGALIGNQLSKGNLDCSHAYGYYDSNGMWHATGVSRDYAQGYYDRDGHWVAGAPNGYYASDGRWVSASSDAQAAGYYDSNGYWVPASSSGYYDSNGRWVSGVAPGYWRNGRWIAGPAVGHYDDYGTWVSGQPSSSTTQAQSGYYDSSGRWVRGSVTGYYDARGRWVSTGFQVASAPAPATYAYTRGSASSADLDARIDRLDRRIRRAVADGSISSRQGDRALRRLDGVRDDERRLVDQLDSLRSDLSLDDRGD